MSTPFLLLLFEPHSAIQLNIALSLFVSLVMIYPLRKEIDKGMLARFSWGSLVCIPAGLLVFVFLEVQLLKIVVSLFILASTLLLLCRFRFAQTKRRDWYSGGLSGFLTASIGLPGPPLLVYFAAIGIDKGKQRSTTLAFYLLVYSLSLALQSVTDRWETSTLISLAACLPISLAGIWFGHWVHRYINQSLFRWISYTILFCSGAYLLTTSM
jgi:uncharacterized membrane protein YfcA